MEILDRGMLLALMKALYVIKWESDDEDATVFELIGSPYVAKLYNDAVDEIIRLEAGKPDAIKKWAHWRAIEEHPAQLQRTRDRIRRKMPIWSSWSEQEKRQMIEILLSPFVAAPETLHELILLSSLS
jgi:hypothetical protein